MNMAVLAGMLFPSSSTFVNAMAAIVFVSHLLAGFKESKGADNLQYSKFVVAISSEVEEGERKNKVISSRRGMLLTYSPALLASMASFAIIGPNNSRCQLLSLTLTLHFLKRVLEVVFIHRYSGVMALDAAIQISFSYFTKVAIGIYAQHLTLAMEEPALDLKLAGQALFLLGISGNLHHHYLLSKLREKNGGKSGGYQIPKGGLFSLVICPHYLCEIIEFFGLALISQTFFMLCLALAGMFYLMGRSYITRKWYLSKFDDFPVHVKALIPFVF